MRADWEKARLEMQAWFEAAHTDPATALQILTTHAGWCRSREAYDRERDVVIRRGISASFLSDPELGRFTPSSGVR
ncbi:hypothetical protein [Actinomadura litoris]|uniref:hypothetical protein n=1 Tax=Actinomadura litoris TaxID=2678616 RepID=UPI001FA7AD48|nr:hypothetical protein [Actinomadura litoris]